MFSIIISEKGGAERREVYDRTEINVGRVQGNDLMLPKGNVSKRHARLLFRDGRFIVTDLKSTNGTYVNGRKIAQATIVREGDKIYIGDFVLRIETAAGGEAQNDSQAEAGSQSGAERNLHTGEPRIESKDAASGDGVSHFPLEQDPDESVPQYAVPGPPRVPTGAQRASQKPPGGVTTPPPMSPQPPGGRSEGSTSGPPPMAPTGGTPLPQAAGPQAAMAQGASATPIPVSSGAPQPPVTSGSGSPSGPPGGPQMTTPAPPPRSAAPPVQIPSAPSPLPAPSPSAIPISSGNRRPSPPSSEDASIDVEAMTAHRKALAQLVSRATQAIDLSSIASGAPPNDGLVAQLDQALGQAAGQMKSSGEVPAGLEVDTLIAEAKQELIDVGPLGALLEDEDVSEVQVVRHDYVVAMYGRNRPRASEVAFTSEAAVGLLIRRLCHESGRPLATGEVFVERRLRRGARMFAVLPPATDLSHMLVLRKAQRADFLLDDLVRAGTISRAIATVLTQCVQANANILVTGALGAGATSLLGGLASAGSTDDRVMVLQEDDEIIFNQPHTVNVLLGDTAEYGARAVNAAVRVRPDRLVVGAFAGHVAAEVVDAIGDGVSGVLAAARAPTIRQLCARLPADLAATRPGLPVDSAREWLGSAFDIVLEIARLRDGRHRVTRVAEFVVEEHALSARDIFVFSAERTAAGGSVEGSFYASGVIPRIVEDMALRGAPVDTSLFKRPQGR